MFQSILKSSTVDVMAYFPDESIIDLAQDKTCAICLIEFEHADSVASSATGNCEHVFHHKCITSWLNTTTDAQECPCCRQAYIETSRKEIAAGNISISSTSVSEETV